MPKLAPGPASWDDLAAYGIETKGDLEVCYADKRAIRDVLQKSGLLVSIGEQSAK